MDVMGISEISSATTGSQEGASLSDPLSNLGSDEFLRLLVTQLQHQDPLAPLGDTEFISELTEFSSLEQLTNINDNLMRAELAQVAMNNAATLGLVGKKVAVQADWIGLEDGTAHEIVFDLDSPSAGTVLRIYDAEGNLVREIDLGSLSSGKNEVSWDGKDSEGNDCVDGLYTLAVSAEDFSGDELAIESRVLVNVDSVFMGEEGVKIRSNGAEYDASDVVEVFGN